MANKDQVQVVAFHLKEEVEITENYDMLALPDTYKQELLAAFQVNNPKRKSLPVNDLNRLVRLVMPDVYSIDSYAGYLSNKGGNWLRAAPGTIEMRAVRILLDEWCQMHEMGGVQFPSSWKPITRSIKLNDWTKGDNGTAAHDDGAVWDLLPAKLARLIEGQPIDLGGSNSLIFYRVSKNPTAKGQEMMSWPPLAYDDEWFYSYYLRIVVATVPFDPKPKVNVYLGIRQWVSTPDRFLKHSQNMSVYLRAGVPYIKSDTSHPAFQVAFTQIRPPDFKMEWVDNVPQLLQNIGFQHKVVDPQKMREDPSTPLRSTTLPNAALVYNSQMGSPEHHVKRGVYPVERLRLLHQLQQYWKHLLAPVPLLERAAKRGSKDQPFSERKETDYQRRWARIRQQQLGPQIAIEVHYLQQKSLQPMLNAIADVLGVSASVGETNREGVTLQVTARKLGLIGADLQLSQNETWTDVAEKRRKDVVEILEVTNIPTISLVETLGPGKYDRGADPYRALRAGFADAGRLSQFFTPVTNEDDDKHRLQRAVLDGLRQLGVHEAGIPREGRRWTLNDWNYAVAGFWLVRQSRKVSVSNQQRFLPTLVYIGGEDGRVLAWVAGMNTMLPYHEVLLRAGRGELNDGLDRDDIARRLPQDIEMLLGQEDVVLAVEAVHSGMRSKVMRWLQDGLIEQDVITFKSKVRWTPDEKQRLRLVRVRNVRDEVPAWYVSRAEDKAGIFAGLWQIGDRVFGSTSGTPDQQQFKRDYTKTDTNRATKSTPMPGLYELTTAFIQQGDDPAEIADMVHQLRTGSVQFGNATAHTLPLHMAKLVEEYLLWVDDDEIDDENELES